MTKILCVALAQYPGTTDVGTVLAEAATAGADIVVFPEMFSNGYVRFDPAEAGAEGRWVAGAIPVDGPYVEAFRQAARKHHLHVVTTLLEAAEPKPYNTALLIDPSGATVLTHRKNHICFFDSPEMACQPGVDASVVDIDTRSGPVKVGMMICMDREFPDVARSLAVKGAEVVLVPNCCALVDDPEVGDVRFAGTRGKAFDHVMGIAVANYPAPKADGHSFAVGAQGEVLAMAGREAELVIADFDLDRIRTTQKADWFRRVG